MKCNWVESNIENYLVGALPAAEMDKIEAHLPGCDRCQKLIADYSATLELLALEAASQPTPEAAVKSGHTERFLSKLEDRPQSVPQLQGVTNRVAPPQPLHRTGWNWGRIIAPVLAASLLVISLLGFLAFNLQNQLSQQQEQNRTLNAQVQQRAENLATLRTQYDQLLADKTTLTANLTTQAEQLKEQVARLKASQEQVTIAQNISVLLAKSGVTAHTVTSEKVALTVVMAPDDRAAGLLAHSFPILPEGQVYQAWLTHTTGALVPGGQLKLVALPDGSVSHALITMPEPMANYTTLWITIEKPGATSPTGKEVIRDKLA